MMFFYRLLLALFPVSFRAEYGEAMRLMVEERFAEARGLEKVALALEVTADAISSAIGAHFDLLRQDLRMTIRSMRREPGFAATVIAVAAIGIGATTAAYSVLDSVLIRSLPFPESERLVKLYQDQSSNGYRDMELSPANFRDWRAEASSFESMGAYYTGSANLVGADEPARLVSSVVTADLLPTLGVRPALGRFFTAEDDLPGAAATVILSDSLWRERFEADPNVLGEAIMIDDESTLVIGVMPASFQFPSRGTRLWLPTRFEETNFEDRADNWLVGVGRIRSGVTLEETRSEMSLIAARLARAYPEANADNGATVLEMREQFSSSSRLLVLALFGAALCVLLIACTNLASLLLTRALARQPELALRNALGAGRERLLRQLMTESLVLALIGGALGVMLAIVVTPFGAQLVPHNLPVAAPEVDPRILLFALAVTLLTGIGFGVGPAFRACSEVSTDALREGPRAGSGVRRERFRSTLVFAEIALSLALLLVTGLLAQALLRVQDTELGFKPEGVTTLRTWLPHPRYEDPLMRHDFYTRVIDQVRAIPGVEGAGYGSFLPLVMGGGIWPVQLEGQPPEPGARRAASLRFVTPGFLDAMGVPLLDGRGLLNTDTEEALQVAVVSRSFAEHYWPRENPLGKRFDFAFRQRTVVGVVGNVNNRGPERTSEPQVYLPHQQLPPGGLPFYDPKDLAIRSSLPAEQWLPLVRKIIADVDPTQPISDVRSLEAIVATAVAPRTVQLRALAAFALTALLLAAIGIYGLLAYNVSARRSELGLRMALGARPSDVVADLARKLAGLTLAGIAIGTLLGLAMGRILESLLAGVKPHDPTTFIIAFLAVTLTACMGGVIPSLRAARVDPAEVIGKS